MKLLLKKSVNIRTCDCYLISETRLYITNRKKSFKKNAYRKFTAEMLIFETGYIKNIQMKGKTCLTNVASRMAHPNQHRCLSSQCLFSISPKKFDRIQSTIIEII